MSIARRWLRSRPDGASGAAGPLKTYDLAAPRFPPEEPEFGVFETQAWVEASRAYVNSLRQAARSDSLVAEAYLGPVALLASGYCRMKGAVRILELGGGIGPCVDPILSALRPTDIASYQIVDGKHNCSVGRELFADDPRVAFSTTMPRDPIDIALMSSALQYIEHWQGAVESLIALKPAYIYLSRLTLRSGPTIAVRQCVHLGTPPQVAGKAWSWLFNPGELDDFLAARGYRKNLDLYTRDLTAELAELELGPAEVSVRSYCRQDGR
jgi:putative methyltransferase (TIGR04325 family)